MQGRKKQNPYMSWYSGPPKRGSIVDPRNSRKRGSITQLRQDQQKKIEQIRQEQQKKLAAAKLQNSNSNPSPSQSPLTGPIIPAVPIEFTAFHIPPTPDLSRQVSASNTPGTRTPVRVWARRGGSNSSLNTALPPSIEPHEYPDVVNSILDDPNNTLSAKSKEALNALLFFRLKDDDESDSGNTGSSDLADDTRSLHSSRIARRVELRKKYAQGMRSRVKAQRERGHHGYADEVEEWLVSSFHRVEHKDQETSARSPSDIRVIGDIGSPHIGSAATTGATGATRTTGNVGNRRRRSQFGRSALPPPFVLDPEESGSGSGSGSKIGGKNDGKNSKDLRQKQFDQLTRLFVLPQLVKAVGLVDQWNNFNIFEFVELSQGLPVPVMVMSLFERLDYFRTFHLQGAKRQCLMNFLCEINDGYLDLPYHNSSHAADVTHNVYFFLTQASIRPCITDLDIFAAILAACVHDFRHPGQNNAYHENTQHPLAILYNDKSVLESYHIAEASKVLNKPQNNFLADFTKEEKQEIRSTMIHMVLATDMRSHSEHVAHLVSSVEMHESTNSWFTAESKADRALILDTVIHCSDLGNPCKPQDISVKWSHLVFQEFFAQGDLEAKQGIPYSPMCDRNTVFLEQVSLGFANFVVAPLYSSFEKVCPEVKICLENIQNNSVYWTAQRDLKKLEKEQEQEKEKEKEKGVVAAAGAEAQVST